MHPVLFDLFGQPFNSWTLFAMIGAMAAYVSARRSFLRAGIPVAQFQALFVACVLAWVVFAHLGQVLTVGSPGSIVQGFQLSGYVLYGGVLGILGAGAATWLAFGWSRRITARETWDFGTAAILWLLFFGRIGCTLYGCCYGTPSGSWPGYVLDYDHWDHAQRAFPAGLRDVPLHPAPLYEALVLGAILFALHRMRTREALRPGKFPPAVMGWIAWMSYALARFFLEFIRLDPRGSWALGLSPSQWTSLAVLALGGVVLPLEWRARRGRRAPL